jgi:hypothetical protein
LPLSRLCDSASSTCVLTTLEKEANLVCSSLSPESEEQNFCDVLLNCFRSSSRIESWGRNQDRRVVLTPSK